MKDKKGLFRLHDETPVYQFFASIVIIIGIGLSLMLLLVLAGSAVFHSDLNSLNKTASSFSNKDILFLRYILIIQDLALLIIPSLILLTLLKPAGSRTLTELKMPIWKDAGLVIILTFCMFPVTDFTGQINSALHLPDWLSGVQQWMVSKEDTADNLIAGLMVKSTLSDMLLNILTIALIPAIAEELLFRGVFQKIFTGLFRSGHVAIWVTAVIFSAIHFQFFGFLPRLILGLVFGYLFFWSGNLWLPVISHFINNAFPVALSFFQGTQLANSSPEMPLWKQAIYLPLPVIIIVAVLVYIRNKNIPR
jgi:CAAX protease family protein